jgi:hypothetical protein
VRNNFGARPESEVGQNARKQVEPGGLLGKGKQQRLAYTGTLYHVTRGYDRGKLMTASHYETPLGTFTKTDEGRIECPAVALPPPGFGGRS